MKPRLKLLLMIPHLGGGGAEGVIYLLARGLAARGHEVHLGVLACSGPGTNLLPASIHLHRINARRVRYAAWGIIRLLWQVRPDLVLCGIQHLSLAILLLRPFFPPETEILVRQNALPPAHERGISSSLKVFLYRLACRTADGIICQNQAMAEDLCALLPQFNRIHILPNPVDLESIRIRATSSVAHWAGSGPHLLAIGRLSPEKGFDRLLQAFSRVREHYQSADLVILGCGEEDGRLRLQCEDLGIQPAVRFVGYVDEPSTWFAGATLFVCTSINDAMPNAVLEAAAAGMPIVCTPASRGLAELLSSKQGVWLAEDPSVDRIAETLLVALAALQTGQRFEHSWIETHDLEETIRQYEDLILRTTRNAISCSTSLSSFQR